MKESMLNTTLFVNEKQGRFTTKITYNNDGFITSVFDNLPDVFDYFYEVKKRTDGRVHRVMIETEKH
jgi:hypothetical protein